MPITLSEHELLEDLAREIGVLFVNGRTSDLKEAKYQQKIAEMEAIAQAREEEREILLKRLKTAEDAHKEIRSQIGGKNSN